MEINLRPLFTIVFFLSTVPMLSAQDLSLPLVYTTGGEGKQVVYKKPTKQDRNNGMGYLWGDCDECLSEDCSIFASSTLSPQGSTNYFTKNLNDDDPTTAWVEGDSEYGIGEYLELKNVRILSSIVVYNGYQKTPKSFADNSRIKSLRVTENGVDRCILRLKDEMGAQRVSFDDLGLKFISESHFVSTLRFTIMEVYPGTIYKDVAISELFTGGCCVSEASNFSLLNGTKKEIGELISNDSIALIDRNNNLIYATGVELGSIMHDQVLEIMTQNGNKLTVTPNHFVYTGKNNQKIQARQLSIQDSLLIYDHKTGIQLEKIVRIQVIHTPTKTYYFKKLQWGMQHIEWPVRAIFSNIITDDEYLNKINKSRLLR